MRVLYGFRIVAICMLPLAMGACSNPVSDSINAFKNAVNTDVNALLPDAGADAASPNAKASCDVKAGNVFNAAYFCADVQPRQGASQSARVAAWCPGLAADVTACEAMVYAPLQKVTDTGGHDPNCGAIVALFANAGACQRLAGAP